MMLRWLPPHPEHRLVTSRGVVRPGDTLPGPVEVYPESVREWLQPVEASVADGGVQAEDAPAVEPVGHRPDLSGMDYRAVHALAVSLGYVGASRKLVDTVDYLDALPAGDVLAAMEAAR